MKKMSKTMGTTIESLVEQARNGNKDMLEEIIRRIQDRVYGLALRMLFHPVDAEDATQEILIKIITRLDSFRGESRFDTWVYKVASNHLLTARKYKAERWELTFEKCEQMIEEASKDTGHGNSNDAVQELIIEETRISCVHFLLLCLNRALRLAVILGEICNVNSREGGQIMGLTPAAFRQKLSRGRKELVHYISATCGLVNPANRCHCEKLAVLHVKKKHIDPQKLLFATHPCHARRDSNTENLLKELDQLERAAMLIRNNPDYAAPGVFVESMKHLIDSNRFQLLGR